MDSLLSRDFLLRIQAIDFQACWFHSWFTSLQMIERLCFQATTFVYKMAIFTYLIWQEFLPINETSSKRKFCKFSAFSLEFQKFFSITRTFFFPAVVQNNFGNKMPFLLLTLNLQFYFTFFQFSLILANHRVSANIFHSQRNFTLTLQFSFTFQ